jgi:hypothetical protein
MAKKQEVKTTKTEAPVPPNSQKTSKVAVRGASAASGKSKKTASKKTSKAASKEKFEKAKQKSAEKIKQQKAEQPTAPETIEIEKNPKITRPTADEQVLILERQNLVWELRKSKVPFRLISERLIAMGYKAALGTVYEDYDYMLSLAKKEQKKSVEDYIEEEIAVLDDVQLAFYPTLKKTLTASVYGHNERQAKKDAADVVIACVKERSSLRNLKKQEPIKVDVNLLLSELSGVPVEELPDVNGSDDE